VASIGENFTLCHCGEVDLQRRHNLVRKFGLVFIKVGDEVGHGVRCTSGIAENQNFSSTFEVCRDFSEIDVGVSVTGMAMVMLPLSIMSMWSIGIGRNHHEWSRTRIYSHVPDSCFALGDGDKNKSMSEWHRNSLLSTEVID